MKKLFLFVLNEYSIAYSVYYYDDRDCKDYQFEIVLNAKDMIDIKERLKNSFDLDLENIEKSGFANIASREEKFKMIYFNPNNYDILNDHNFDLDLRNETLTIFDDSRHSEDIIYDIDFSKLPKEFKIKYFKK